MLKWLLIGVIVVVAWTIATTLAHILAPVLVAFGIAYMLDPAVEKLAARGMSRTMAATILLFGFLGLIVGLCVVLIPMLIDQIQTFNAHLDHHVKDIDVALDKFGYRLSFLDDNEKLIQLKQTFGIPLEGVHPPFTEYPAMSAAYYELAAGETRGMLSGALANEEVATSALEILAMAAESLLIPVFAYYFLLDWPNITARITRMIPPRRRGYVLDILGQIDGVVSGWVRGQLIVTSTLAVLYAIAFSIVGVKYAVPLGLLVGALTIIPFVGTFVGAGIMAAFIMLGGQGTGPLIGVAVTFVVLHLLEAAVLTPKIVGHKVGLSESAALFAVVAGGKLLGFVGILLAVPIAATVAVLLRQIARHYEKSEFFGKEEDAIVPVTGAMALMMVDEAPEGSRSMEAAEGAGEGHIADDKPDDDPIT